ncbi:hypothetical protein C8R45DRAFT_1131063 [Mycena sanguinolenta]|nr:hypothetical protein C8R45DRAFT_1131063 [Mycena sanguinolenta]
MLAGRTRRTSPSTAPTPPSSPGLPRQYPPLDAISPGDPCAYCAAQPQTADIHNGTWHEGGQRQRGSVRVPGAVCIFGIDLDNPVNVTFMLDGKESRSTRTSRRLRLLVLLPPPRRTSRPRTQAQSHVGGLALVAAAVLGTFVFARHRPREHRKRSAEGASAAAGTGVAPFMGQSPTTPGPGSSTTENTLDVTRLDPALLSLHHLSLRTHLFGPARLGVPALIIHRECVLEARVAQLEAQMRRGLSDSGEEEGEGMPPPHPYSAPGEGSTTGATEGVEAEG